MKVFEMHMCALLLIFKTDCADDTHSRGCLELLLHWLAIYVDLEDTLNLRCGHIYREHISLNVKNALTANDSRRSIASASSIMKSSADLMPFQAKKSDEVFLRMPSIKHIVFRMVLVTLISTNLSATDKHEDSEAVVCVLAASGLTISCS